MTTVLFFGSFQHYSTIVLEALYQTKNIKVLGVVTAPSRPAGRHLRLTPTHTHLWAKAHGLPVFTPKTLGQLEIENLKLEIAPSSIDFILVAGYRMLLPKTWLDLAQVMALNLHPSLLPQYPGPAPAEWALLKGAKETGITIIKMTEEYDLGPIIAQKKLPILPTDTRLTLYQKLYELGGSVMTQVISHQLTVNSPKPQTNVTNVTYARRLSRQDGYIPWPLIQKAWREENVPFQHRPGIFSNLKTENWSLVTERAVRALTGFPGVWTQVTTSKGTKILKILSSTQVQLEGKTPTRFTNLRHRIQYH